MKKPLPASVHVRQVPFNKLSKAAQRVAIAQDAIRQIKANKYYISTGRWVDVAVEASDAVESGMPDIDQQALLYGLPAVPRKITCTCCAGGAAFLSSIRLADKAVIQGGAVETLEEAADQLKRYFSQDQIDLIEEAFEKGGGYCHTDKGDGVAFGLDYKDATERALAIFKNIVKNKGEFKP